MLKIAVHTLGRVMLFYLEGKLAGPWVKELEFCWRSVVGMPPNERGPVRDQNRSDAPEPLKPARVDLSSVTFIDSEGKELLGRMHREGTELVATGCLNKCIVEEITREAKQARAQGESS
jgi:hypothetical protein